MTSAPRVYGTPAVPVCGVALFLILAGCTATAPSAQPPARDGVTFQPDTGGLAVAATGQRIDFGRAPDGVVAALDRELGPGKPLVRTGCPADIVRQIAWGDLVLSFTDERFVGWRAAGGKAGRTCAV